MKDFLSDDRAQATTEYILLLFAALSFFMIVYAHFLKPYVSTLGDKVAGYFDTLLTKGDLHRLPFAP